MCEECAVVLRKIHVSRLDSGANQAAGNTFLLFRVNIPLGYYRGFPVAGSSFITRTRLGEMPHLRKSLYM